jgi:hypothetical protein
MRITLQHLSERLGYAIIDLGVWKRSPRLPKQWGCHEHVAERAELEK